MLPDSLSHTLSTSFRFSISHLSTLDPVPSDYPLTTSPGVRVCSAQQVGSKVRQRARSVSERFPPNPEAASVLSGLRRTDERDWCRAEKSEQLSGVGCAFLPKEDFCLLKYSCVRVTGS
jgi:hypothetical protein